MVSQFNQYEHQVIYCKLAQYSYSPPPVWGITRILKRNQLANEKRKGTCILKCKNPYQYALCHQMDYVEPRYLSYNKTYYFFNLINCDIFWAQTSVSENKQQEPHDVN